VVPGEIGEEQVMVFREAWHRLLRYYEEHCTELLAQRLGGITPLELNILDQVARRPGSVIKDIRKRLGVTGSTLTAAIDRLKEREFLERAVNHRDRRSFKLHLTEAGKDAHARYMGSEHDFIAALFAELRGADERNHFADLLCRATRGLS